jgi:hypothetical protein
VQVILSYLHTGYAFLIYLIDAPEAVAAQGAAAQYNAITGHFRKPT